MSVLIEQPGHIVDVSSASDLASAASVVKLPMWTKSALPAPLESAMNQSASPRAAKAEESGDAAVPRIVAVFVTGPAAPTMIGMPAFWYSLITAWPYRSGASPVTMTASGLCTSAEENALCRDAGLDGS